MAANDTVFPTGVLPMAWCFHSDQLSTFRRFIYLFIFPTEVFCQGYGRQLTQTNRQSEDFKFCFLEMIVLSVRENNSFNFGNARLF